jgi:hypothetical protein
MEKVKNILKVQTVLIIQLLIDIEYQTQNQEMNQLGEITPHINKRYLNHIAMLTSNNIVANLFKLIYEDKNHSFQKIINLIEYNNLIKFKEDFDYFKEELLSIKQQSDLLKIRPIRDMYVAHLDYNREGFLYDLVGIRDLIYHIEKSFKVLFYSVSGENVDFEFDKDTLTELLEDFKFISQTN